MPTYEYLNRKTGTKISLIRPMAERHKPVRVKGGTFYPVSVPSHIGIARGLSIGGGDDVIKGYYREECKQGSKFKSEFKPSVIKRAWATPYE